MEESLITPPEEFSFDEVLTALLDTDHVLDPLYLYRLSDLSPENLGDLKKIWAGIDLVRRRALIEDLEHLTDTNTLLSFESIFRLAIKDNDDQVRFFATRSIEIFDTNDLIPFFLSVLREDVSTDLKAVTASVLGKYVYQGEIDKISKKVQKKIEDQLLLILEGDYPLEVQRRSLEAISYSSREEVQEHILKAYKSGDEEWVSSALFAMGRSYDHQYSDQVLAKLQDTSPKVRLEAVRASGELTLEEAMPVILDSLSDLPEIRAAAIWSLSQIGGEEAGPAINELLDEETTPEEEELILQALERLDFLEEGINLPLFDLPNDDDEYILDDYDSEQDDYDDDFDKDDIGLEDFDLDDDLWLE
ncbi:MAG: HEAT repeat domain-containing protein [Anaerolineales bacterium]|nr:HEAT repeat domain-containing protein [Anaerolineales bacterium]